MSATPIGSDLGDIIRLAVAQGYWITIGPDGADKGNVVISARKQGGEKYDSVSVDELIALGRKEALMHMVRKVTR